jgi:hypothetical protein
MTFCAATGGLILYARVAGRGEALFCVWPNQSTPKAARARPALAALVNLFTSKATPASQPYVAKRPASKPRLLSFDYAQSSAL